MAKYPSGAPTANKRLSIFFALFRLAYSPSHSSERIKLDQSRKVALLNYSRINSINIQGLNLLGHHLKTGARHYVPTVDGIPVIPPYYKKTGS